jgi:hypothetical protein
MFFGGRRCNSNEDGMTRGKGVASGSISLLTVKITECSNREHDTAGINKDATAFTVHMS